jgi:hypothetical protein
MVECRFGNTLEVEQLSVERSHHDPKNKIRRVSPFLRKKNPKNGKRRKLGTFASRRAAEKHERAVQFFKREG